MVPAIVSLALLLLDQFMKLWTVNNVDLNTGIRSFLPGVLHFTHIKNFGALFGVMQGASWLRWVLLVLLIAFTAVMVYALLRGCFRSNLCRWGGLLLLAGILGNGVDRALFGHVVDMLEFEPFTFAIFNLADVMVLVGGILFAIAIFTGGLSLRGDEEEEEPVPVPQRPREEAPVRTRRVREEAEEAPVRARRVREEVEEAPVRARRVREEVEEAPVRARRPVTPSAPAAETPVRRPSPAGEAAPVRRSIPVTPASQPRRPMPSTSEQLEARRRAVALDPEQAVVRPRRPAAPAATAAPAAEAPVRRSAPRPEAPKAPVKTPAPAVEEIAAVVEEKVAAPVVPTVKRVVTAQTAPVKAPAPAPAPAADEFDLESILAEFK